MVSREALKALHSQTVLVTVIDNACNANGDEGTESQSVIERIDGDETEHEASSAACIKHFELHLRAKIEGADRLDGLGSSADEVLVISI